MQAGKVIGMLDVIFATGEDDLAQVFVARLSDGSSIEFVESVQPPVPREEKWVIIVSTLRGCPVGCAICDAGISYSGRLTKEEIVDQVLHLVERRFPDRRVPVPKFKVQFARMGDPALNDAVLEAIEELPQRMEAAGLMPCISTIAPAGRQDFFDRLIEVKERLFGGGRFQMQFSLHTTDDEARRRLIPARTWSMAQMAAWGDRFFMPGDRKIALNFAPARGFALDPDALRERFHPDRFLVKLTPVNPTRRAARSGLVGLIDPADPAGYERIVDSFRARGYDTLLSIGELRENLIGSNCGMYIGRTG
jgi:23S rRNA (adenine2503-C2)-methyltransferase